MATQDDSKVFYECGRELMRNGELSDAASMFQKSVQCDPHFKSLELLGECLLRLQQHRLAVVPLAAATALNRGVRAPSLLAEALFCDGKHDDARDLANEALRRDPRNRRALNILNKIAEISKPA